MSSLPLQKRNVVMKFRKVLSFDSPEMQHPICEGHFVDRITSRP